MFASAQASRPLRVSHVCGLMTHARAPHCSHSYLFQQSTAPACWQRLPRASFSHTPSQVAKQSKAAMSLCLWVRAMDTYAKIIKIVEPKRNALRIAQVRVTRALLGRAGEPMHSPRLACVREGLSHRTLRSGMHEVLTL